MLAVLSDSVPVLLCTLFLARPSRTYVRPIAHLRSAENGDLVGIEAQSRTLCFCFTHFLAQMDSGVLSDAAFTASLRRYDLAVS